MPADPNIGNREREILTAIVETFISTGEPVGSRTLARSNREGLSPASIRNVMADLSDAGFLEQPHTSAGRIPTTEAYRYYVEQMSGNARLAPQEETMISDTLAGITDVQEFMERTSHVLSLISRNVGVTVAFSAAMMLASLNASSFIVVAGDTTVAGTVAVAEDMPDIAANSYSIAFGDFARGYLVVDRVGIRVLRDPYSAKPYVLFYTTKRVGGGVQNFEAIKLMKFAAS